jgi:hypothetical protein
MKNIIRLLLGAFAKLRKATISLVRFVHMSVCMEQFDIPRRGFMKFGIWGCLENLLRKSEFHYHLRRITVILHEDFVHV